MPEEQTQKSFPIVSEGEHKFQIVDIESESEELIVIKCEVVSTKDKGLTILHRLDNNQDGKFFWITKFFLKCIGEPSEGEVTVDTDAFIGRQFSGDVKHSVNSGKTYANIKKFIYSEDPQPVKSINPGNTKEPGEILWND